jgi:hypothetical protein
MAATVQVDDRQNHEKMLSVLWVTRRSLDNVGTLLQYEQYQSADLVLQDELPYERQIEMVAESGDLKYRQQDSEKHANRKQALIAPKEVDRPFECRNRSHGLGRGPNGRLRWKNARRSLAVHS